MYVRIEDLPNQPETYGQNCIDGKCSGCGECCVDLLPVTPDEFHRIKVYVKKHGIREHRQAPFFDPQAIDMSCPFRNAKTRKCEIYPARPYICRTFLCNKTIDDARKDRDLIHKERSVYSLKYEIFGNPETLTLLMTVSAMKAQRIINGKE